MLFVFIPNPLENYCNLNKIHVKNIRAKLDNSDLLVADVAGNSSIGPQVHIIALEECIKNHIFTEFECYITSLAILRLHC